MDQRPETCSICGCQVHRSGEYATPTIAGRSHATNHHFVAERFFGRSRNRRGTKRDGIFEICPFGHEHETAVYCYECHEELLHNPILLPTDIEVLAELVKRRGINETSKPEHREKIAARVLLLHEAISVGLKELLTQP
jgi:hypothetical protein